jgi:cysteinyl-tRNA synthetase
MTTRSSRAHRALVAAAAALAAGLFACSDSTSNGSSAPGTGGAGGVTAGTGGDATAKGGSSNSSAVGATGGTTGTGGRTTGTGGGTTSTGGRTAGSGGETTGPGGGGGSAVDAGAETGTVRDDAGGGPDVPIDTARPEDSATDTGTGPNDGPMVSVDGRRGSGLPQPMCVWNEAYQENYAADSVAEILAGARNCYVLIDPFASTDARAAIGQMQQSGNTVSCYVSVGTCEDWRDDFAAMKPYCVTKQWGDWPGEYFVDRTDPALVALEEARIDKMTAWGCDMVEFDNMDFAFDSAYRSQYGITATAAQGEAYNETLCAYVHGKGMGCMAKSSARGAADFDGLTVESSPADMDWWTPADMQGMLSSGKIGIVVHYDESDCASILSHYQSEYGSKLSFICEDRALKNYRHFP